VLVLLLGVCAVGLIAGAGQPRTAPARRTPSASSRPAPSASTAPLPTTGDAIRYARAYALELFGWGTQSGATPRDYESALFQQTTAGGSDQDGYSTDLDAYYPSDDAWAFLRSLRTRQSLTIDTAVVPSGWTAVAAQAPSTNTAVTIDGTRHRTGTQNGKSIAEASPVAFTVFLDCPRSGCRVLRLSKPGSPLR
jgi:hypothetical protein